MGSVIHGSSHSAIKHFRDNPAAMAVYWVYLARANNEAVAWPSLRGLETDTGWNKDTCAKGRDWLVAHGALERVTDYTRPEWRKLKKADATRRRNFDKTEYFRPTGVLTIGNVTYTMLYYGSQSAAIAEDEADNTSDVRQERTSGRNGHPVGTDIRSGGTELNTIPVLDPNAIKLDATTPVASVEQSVKQPKKKDKAPKGAGLPTEDQTRRTDLMKAWWDALPELNRPNVTSIYAIPGYHTAAQAALGKGLTPAKMAYYVKALTYAGQFYHDKTLKFGAACNDAPVWCAVHYRPPTPKLDEQDAPVNPEDLSESIQAALNAWMEKRAG